MTQPNNPFKTDGFWYKGNIHTHSTNSDGILDMVQLSYLYKYRGYDFLSITDHNRLTDVGRISEYDTYPTNLKLFKRIKDFTLIPGQEVHAGKTEVNTSIHLVCLNIKEELKPKDPQSVIDDALAQGAEVIIGHPYVSCLTLTDLLRLQGYLGIEVFNSASYHDVNKGYSTVHWDDLLVRGRLTYGFATDDAHWFFYHHIPVDACTAWIMVRAKELTVKALMESIKKGLFYSSTGPEIFDVELTEETIHVKTSPAKSITFIGESNRGEKITAQSPISEVTYRISAKRGIPMKFPPRYIRIEVEDEKGRIAWTNPLIFQDVNDILKQPHPY